MENPSLVEKQTFTVKEVAGLLGFSTNSIYKFLKEGRIQAERLGRGRFRIPKEEIERFLGHKEHPGHRQAPAPSPAPSTGIAPARAASRIDAGGSGSPEAAPLPPSPVPSAGILDRVAILPKNHRPGVPALFDWFVGIVLVLLGFSFLLLPGDVRFLVTSTMAMRLYGTILAAVGLGFLWLDVAGVTRRPLATVIHVGALLSVALLLPYYAVFSDWLGLTRVGALLVVLLLSLRIPSLPSERRFVLLIALLGAISGIIVFFKPTRLGWLPLVTVIATYRILLVLLWAFIIVGFLRLTRWAETQAPRIRRVVFLAVGLIIVPFTIVQATHGRWDQLAFTLTLATFVFLVPFQHRFEDVPVRRVSAISLAFLWVGILLIALIGTTRLFHFHIERSYLRSAERAAQRAHGEIRDFLNSAASATKGPTENPLLTNAIRRRSSEGLESVARAAHQVSAGTLAQVFVTSPDGTVMAQYPLGSPPPAERAAVREAVSVAVAEGTTIVSEPRVDEEDVPRLTLVVATSILAPDGSPRGALVGAIDTTELGERLGELRFREEGVILVANRAGRYLFHPDHSLVGRPVENSQGLLRALNGERSVTRGTSDQGPGTYLKALEPLPEYGWGIVAEHPLYRAYQLSNLLVVLTMVTIFGAVAGSLAVIVHLLRPRRHVPIPAEAA